MAGRTADRVVHGLAVLEATTLDASRSQRQRLLHGVGLARALRRGIGRIATGGPARGDLLIGLALGRIGHGGQGILADVLDEAAEAVAALPRGRARKPAEERLPEGRSPTDLGLAQQVGVGDLLLVRTAGRGLGEGAGIPAVAVEQGVARVADVGVVGGEHQRHALGHHRRRPETDQRTHQFTVQGAATRRIQGLEPLEGRLQGRPLRIALADQGQLVGTDDGQLGGLIELAQVELVQEAEQPIAMLRSAHAGQGHRPFDGRPGTGLGEDAIGPLGHRTTLDGHAGGIADEPVLMAQALPRLGDGLRAGAFQVELLQLAPQLGRGGQLRGRGRSGALLANVGHAVDRRLGAAAADGEVHRAIPGVDHQVGQGQRTAADELLLLGLVARTIGSEVDGVHRAVGPVIGEDGVLVAGRELGPLAGGHTGG